MVCMPFLTIWAGTDGQENVILTPLFLLKGNEKLYLPYSAVASLSIAAFTIAIIEITKFKNRLTQIKLGALNSLIMAASMVVPFIFVRELENFYQGAFGIALFFPAIALLCNSIANRYIRKDERLVRESERLR